PSSISRPTLIRPARAASLRSTGTASSRLPSRMSTVGAMSGTLATIFSLEKSRKWIIREGLKGISRTGAGASMARGLKKSRGLRKGSPGSAGGQRHSCLLLGSIDDAPSCVLVGGVGGLCAAAAGRRFDEWRTGHDEQLDSELAHPDAERLAGAERRCARRGRVPRDRGASADIQG